MSERLAIGISFGTTTCCVATVRNGAAEVIANDMGNRVTRANIGYSTCEGTSNTVSEVTCGDPAYNALPRNCENTLMNVLRVLGKEFDSEGVQEDVNDKQYFSSKVVKDNDTGLTAFAVQHDGKEEVVSASAAAGIIIKQMKATAEIFLGKQVDDAVISVPEHFDETVRGAIVAAATANGLHVMRLINEPTAAAMAYGFDAPRAGNQKTNALVFDFGGTCFDVTLLDVQANGVITKAAGTGDATLGGWELDAKLLDFCSKEFRRKARFNGKLDNKAKYRLKQQCEMVKKTLSTAAESAIEVDCLANDKDFSASITRERFELMANDTIEDTVAIMEEMLEEAGVAPEDVENVIFVGGSSKIPKVQELVRAALAKAKFHTETNPDEVIALGAAIQAAAMHCSTYASDQRSKTAIVENQQGEASAVEVKLLGANVCVEDAKKNLVPVLLAGSVLPCSATKVFEAKGKEEVLLTMHQGSSDAKKDNAVFAKVKLANEGGKKGLAVEFSVDEAGNFGCGVVGEEKVVVKL